MERIVDILYVNTVLRIRDVYPGSRIGVFPIQDPGSKRFSDSGSGSTFASKNLIILTQKLSLSSRKYDPGCSSPKVAYYL
jgi:hypothetical protein